MPKCRQSFVYVSGVFFEKASSSYSTVPHKAFCSIAVAKKACHTDTELSGDRHSVARSINFN